MFWPVHFSQNPWKIHQEPPRSSQNPWKIAQPNPPLRPRGTAPPSMPRRPTLPTTRRRPRARNGAAAARGPALQPKAALEIQWKLGENMLLI